MYSQTSRNHSTGNRKSNLERYQETPNHEGKGELHRHFHDSITAASPLYNTEARRIPTTTKLSSALVDVSSTPITSEHTQVKRNHLSKLRQTGLFDDESPTSILDLNTSSLWQQHLNRLMDESSGDLGKLVLVPDNARPLPLSYQSTPKRVGRPMLSKSPVLASTHRPCRWNSEVPVQSSSSSGDHHRTNPLLTTSSSSSPRLPPPPFLGSPVANHPRPTSISSPDTRPVLPSRSELDISDHCELPSFTRTRRNRGRRIRRHTSDSVLARPERRDSESGEDTSEELGMRKSV